MCQLFILWLSIYYFIIIFICQIYVDLIFDPPAFIPSSRYHFCIFLPWFDSEYYGHSMVKMKWKLTITWQIRRIWNAQVNNPGFLCPSKTLRNESIRALPGIFFTYLFDGSVRPNLYEQKELPLDYSVHIIILNLSLLSNWPWKYWRNIGAC